MHTVCMERAANKGGKNANNSEGSTIPPTTKRRWHQVAKSQAQLFNLREEKKKKKNCWNYDEMAEARGPHFNASGLITNLSPNRILSLIVAEVITDPFSYPPPSPTDAGVSDS